MERRYWNRANVALKLYYQRQVSSSFWKQAEIQNCWERDLHLGFCFEPWRLKRIRFLWCSQIRHSRLQNPAQQQSAASSQQLCARHIRLRTEHWFGWASSAAQNLWNWQKRKGYGKYCEYGHSSLPALKWKVIW